MQRTVTAALAAALIGGAALIAPAQPASAQGAAAQSTTTEPSSGRQARPARAGTRIYVTPSRGVYRECAARLVVEHRPSGDTIVPDTRCWWTGASR